VVILRGTEGDRPSGACRWIVVSSEIPEEPRSDLLQHSYNAAGDLVGTRHDLPLAAGGAMDIQRADLGPGPDHWIFAGRDGANCATPGTDISLPRAGRIQVRVGLLCLQADGTFIPAECSAEAEVEGIYGSRVGVVTEEGSDCGAPSRTEAISEDQAVLTANEKAIFAKAVSVQTGNQITITPTFSLDLGVGFSGPGMSANTGVRFGWSSTRSDHTGRSSDILQAFGNGGTGIPLTASLDAGGRIEIKSHCRTMASARCAMDLAGLWLLGRAHCPGLDPLFVAEIRGDEDAVSQALRLAEAFEATRTGRQR
jgi:hypothetical protein